MAITFPTNPNDGDKYTLGNNTYTYDAAQDAWVGAFSGDVDTEDFVAGDNVTISESDAKVEIAVSGDFTTTVTAPRGVGDTWDTELNDDVQLDYSKYQNFILEFTDDVTFTNPDSDDLLVGQSGFIVIKQDDTGDHVLSLASKYETPSAEGLVLSSLAGATDIVPYIVMSKSRILLGTAQLEFGHGNA